MDGGSMERLENRDIGSLSQPPLHRPDFYRRKNPSLGLSTFKYRKCEPMPGIG